MQKDNVLVLKRMLNRLYALTALDKKMFTLNVIAVYSYKCNKYFLNYLWNFFSIFEIELESKIKKSIATVK